MIKTFLWSMVFSLGFIILETAVLSNLFFLPAVPDLLLIMLLYVSICNNALLGECTGFASGLMLDFFSASPLGLNALIRTLIGYIAGSFKEIIAVNSILVPMLFTAAATVCKALIIRVLSFLFYGSVAAYNIFALPFWLELILNTLLAPPLFAFLSLFAPILTASRTGRRRSGT